YKTYWVTTTAAPWTTLGEAIRQAVYSGDRLILLNLVVFAVIAAAVLLGRVPFEYRIFSIAALCLYLTKHTDPLLQSTTRYSLAVFAAYPAISHRLGRGLLFASLVCVAVILNLFLFRVFLDWGLVV
ncbi:MAG TPA: hypothetical protein VHC72_21735, partial [Bryobacteraceae bacterium]|nr:hypothetical protein [Bryobacteraceae bacterium]